MANSIATSAVPSGIAGDSHVASAEETIRGVDGEASPNAQSAWNSPSRCLASSNGKLAPERNTTVPPAFAPEAGAAATVTGGARSARARASARSGRYSKSSPPEALATSARRSSPLKDRETGFVTQEAGSTAGTTHSKPDATLRAATLTAPTWHDDWVIAPPAPRGSAGCVSTVTATPPSVEPRRGVTESAATSSPNANVAAARSPESGGAADEASPICTATSPGSCAGTSQNANAEDTKRIAAAPKAPTQHASSPSRMCAPAILSSDPPDAGPSSGIAKNAAGGVRISNEGGPSPPNEAMDAGAAPIAATVTVVHPAGTRGGAAQSTVAYPTHIPLRRISADHEACGGSAPSRVPVTHTSHACTSTAGETWSPKRQVSGTSSSSYSPVFSYVTSTSRRRRARRPAPPPVPPATRRA